MYRRPYRRSAAPRGGFRRRRFGPRLHAAKEPQRWEVGQFALFNIINITDSADPNSTIVTSLAQIQGHLGDSGSSQGRVLDSAARSLEIGGIVFRYEIMSNLTDSLTPPTSGELDNRLRWRVILASDRLDQVGQPVSIPNWFNVTSPVVAAGSVAAEDIDDQYPTRIHWQNYHGTSWTNREGNGSTAISPSTVHVDNRRGGANLRLRLRLDDQHGLFLHFAQAVASPTNGEATFISSLEFVGTIYYRWRF